MLSIAASAVGSPCVLGLDMDADALCTAAANADEAECTAMVRAADADRWYSDEGCSGCENRVSLGRFCCH